MGKEVTAPPPPSYPTYSCPKNPLPKNTTTTTGGRRGGCRTTDHPERWRQTEIQTQRQTDIKIQDRQTDSQGDGETLLKELKEIRKEKKD